MHSDEKRSVSDTVVAVIAMLAIAGSIYLLVWAIVAIVKS